MIERNTMEFSVLSNLNHGLKDKDLIEKAKALLKNSDFVIANHSEVLGNEKTKLAIITKKDTVWIEDTKINASKSILKKFLKNLSLVSL